MFAQSVVPLLAARFGAAGEGGALWGTALMVPESSLEEALRACAAAEPAQSEGIRWGTRVDEDRIVFSLRGGQAAERDAFLDRLIQRLGPVRVRRGDTRPAQLLTDALLARGARLAVAESCTGGLVGKYLTDLAGSSRVFWGGFLSYSNEAKARLLGVADRLLASDGAVSEPVVRAMAEGARAASGADVGLAVSGIAGPDGGSVEKPVGTVWMAVALKGKASEACRFSFSGTRDMIRRRSAVAVMLFAEARLLDREFLDTRAKW